MSDNPRVALYGAKYTVALANRHPIWADEAGHHRGTSLRIRRRDRPRRRTARRHPPRRPARRGVHRRLPAQHGVELQHGGQAADRRGAPRPDPRTRTPRDDGRPAGARPRLVRRTAVCFTTSTPVGSTPTVTGSPGVNVRARELAICALITEPSGRMAYTREIGPRNATELTVAVPAGSAATVTDSGRTIASPVPEAIDPSSVRHRRPQQLGLAVRNLAGTLLFSPTNSATNGVAGLAYSSAGAAICSSRPWFITPTRSATASASSWSWVTNSVVVPTSSWTRRISSRSCTRTLASSADSGSSRSSTRGWIASARASATRCCWPPDSSLAYLSRVRRQPDQVQHVGGPRSALALGFSAHLQPEGDVVQHGQVREQAVGLEHHAHIAFVGGHVG